MIGLIRALLVGLMVCSGFGSASAQSFGGVQSPVVVTTNHTIAATDCNRVLQAGSGSSGAFTVTLPAITGFPIGCVVTLKNGDTALAKTLSGFPADAGTILPALQTVSVSISNGVWITIGVSPQSTLPPKFTRLTGVQQTFTPDAGAKLLEIVLVGGGGGGSGNGARNAIGFNQYGGVGTPSGVGGLSATVTISNASPAVVTWASHGLGCNDPVYFATTGALPSPLSPGTIYYVMCDGSITANTFEISAIQFDVPLTCAVYAPRCQTAINTSSAGSGTQTGNAYMYVAFGGYGGGIVGDQANPGGYRGCDGNGPAGYVQSYGLFGSQGENAYIYPGYSIDGGRGGGTPFGGGAAGGVDGIAFTGGGGDGGRPTSVSAGGGAGGGAGYCRIWLQPAGPIPLLCGSGGAAGVAQLDPVTISIASPAVITFPNHGFFGGVNPATSASAIQFTTTGSLPTGISAGVTYFVLNAGLTTNTFEISTSFNGSPINTSGSQSGTQSVTSGVAGGAGGSGACYIAQYFR